MTARRRLIPKAEAAEMLQLLAGHGIDLTRCTIDITAEGVRVSPPAPESAATPAGNAFDQWKRKNADHGRPAHRPEAA